MLRPLGPRSRSTSTPPTSPSRRSLKTLAVLAALAGLVVGLMAGPAQARERGTSYDDRAQRGPVTSVLQFSGPRRFTDETSATFVVRWLSGGRPVQGRVRLERRVGKRWKVVKRGVTGAYGRVSFTVSPRTDTRWRATTLGNELAGPARSRVHRLDNRPPGRPVHLPKQAPKPRRHLPPQAHAKGAGPNARITGIPQGVWRQMTGRSWHAGCPVGRAGLRLLKVNYWDYDGYRRRGEIVAAAGAIDNMAGALKEMYRRKLPIRAMYRVDRFGWSGRLRGADDYASMAAGNTSAFNCRDVVGRPGVRSPHATGRSLDINPWENPYTSPQGVHPNGWWKGRSHGRVAWRSRGHIVVKVMARHGMRWTYGASDLHHFDAGSGHAREVVLQRCAELGCH